MSDSQPPNRIAELRTAKGWSQVELAARVGVSNQQISRLETGKAELTTEWITRVCLALGVHFMEIFSKSDRKVLEINSIFRGEFLRKDDKDFDPAPADTISLALLCLDVERVKHKSEDAISSLEDAVSQMEFPKEALDPPSAELVEETRPSTSRIPVYASAEAGDGEMSIGAQIGTIPTPPGLADIQGGYAVHIVGDSMEPRLFQGWLAQVAPLPPRAGQFCILQMRGEHDGEHMAVIKTYLRSRPDSYEVEQYNPAEVKTYPKDRVDKIHRIVGITFE